MKLDRRMRNILLENDILMRFLFILHEKCDYSDSNFLSALLLKFKLDDFQLQETRSYVNALRIKSIELDFENERDVKYLLKFLREYKKRLMRDHL